LQSNRVVISEARYSTTIFQARQLFFAPDINSAEITIAGDATQDSQQSLRNRFF
jgi:hypothetical protein